MQLPPSSARNAGADIAGERVADGLELRRQAGQTVGDDAAESLDAVVDRDVEALTAVGRVGEAAIVSRRIVALADEGLQRCPNARAPHYASIPDQAVGLVSDDARRALVGDIAAIGADDRCPGTIAHRVAARHLHIFVTHAADKGERAADRDRHVSPHMAVAHALVEVGGVLLVPATADTDANHRQYGVGRNADARLGRMGRALIGEVDQLRTAGPGDERTGRFHPGIAKAVMAFDLDRTLARFHRRAGIDRVDPAGGRIVLLQRTGESRAVAIDPRARGERACLDGDIGRPQCNRRAADTADRVAVGSLVVIGEMPLVPHRSGSGRIAAPGRDIDARGERGVGHRVAVGIELTGQHFGCLDVRRHIDMRPAHRWLGFLFAALILRQRARRDGERRESQAEGADMTSHAITPRIRNKCRSGGRSGCIAPH